MANFEHAGSSRTGTDLRKLLQSIDRKGYPAYKQTKGRWSYGRYILSIDHVQGDPFASPSKVSVTVPARTALFPEALFAVKHRRIARAERTLSALPVVTKISSVIRVETPPTTEVE